ncbi:DUF7409 domain-containing protein [Halobellus rubicundus]|uniref:Helix-hairpin-helix domain-containing protein n=1 Tax=Halobellus rubicundus TaxID=2996466 RepID=A0ABD5MCH4_9EURY
MTGDRETEGDGEAAGDGLDPETVVGPGDEAPAVGSESESDHDGDGDGNGVGTADIPLPWNTVSDSATESEEATDDTDTDADAEAEADADDPTSGARPVPDSFEDLRFVGPKTAPILADSGVSIADICEKRVSYRDLTEAGVNPGVAAKIRREHSLSWSLDGGGTDLDRRSSQIRGLDDAERAWIAESSGWSTGGEDDAAAETDGSGDATAGEAAWRAQTDAGVPEAGNGESSSGAESRSGSESETANGEAPATAGEAAWRAESGVASDDDESAAGDSVGSDTATDSESAWRRRSAPTPLTAVAGFDSEVTTTLRKAGIGSVRRLATADPESVADALELDPERVRAWRDRARDHESSDEK